MSELLNPGIVSLASVALSVVLLLVGLLLWFFVNRASSRANEQIALLQALLDQQKRQNALLRRLCEANEPEGECSRTFHSREGERRRRLHSSGRRALI